MDESKEGTDGEELNVNNEAQISMSRIERTRQNIQDIIDDADIDTGPPAATVSRIEKTRLEIQKLLECSELDSLSIENAPVSSNNHLSNTREKRPNDNQENNLSLNEVAYGSIGVNTSPVQPTSSLPIRPDNSNESTAALKAKIHMLQQAYDAMADKAGESLF